MAKEFAILIDLCAFIIPLHLSVYFDGILKIVQQTKECDEGWQEIRLFVHVRSYSLCIVFRLELKPSN